MPYEITQCYLPPGRGDIPALTPDEAITRLSEIRPTFCAIPITHYDNDNKAMMRRRFRPRHPLHEAHV